MGVSVWVSPFSYPVTVTGSEATMGDDIRAPVLWRRPNAKTYSYNQEFGGSYYKPMVDYINKKEQQGIFWEKPEDKVHLPDPAETYMAKGIPRLESVSGLGDLDDFLVRARSGRTKEVNESSGREIIRCPALTFVHLKHLLCPLSSAQ